MQDYERALKDIETALALAEKYKINNATVIMMKRFYSKVKAEYQKGLELKARIMSASSNISIEEALEKIKKDKKIK